MRYMHQKHHGHYYILKMDISKFFNAASNGTGLGACKNLRARKHLLDFASVASMRTGEPRTR